MRTLLLISVFASLAARAAETGKPAMSAVREKLRARILESIPPPPTPAPKPASEEKKGEDIPVVLQPVVVTESKLIQRATATMERAEQERRDETFSRLDGGKIGQVGPMEIGSWWEPGEGWTFLRLNKAPTRRQIEASQTRMKELNELQNFGKGGEKSKPAR